MPAPAEARTQVRLFNPEERYALAEVLAKCGAEPGKVYLAAQDVEDLHVDRLVRLVDGVSYFGVPSASERVKGWHWMVADEARNWKPELRER